MIIFIVLWGGAINQNGNSMSITVLMLRPEEELRKSTEYSGINPQLVTYIETHGSEPIWVILLKWKGIKNGI